MDHAMKKCEIANFYGQASDADAYGCNGSLFSWKTSWILSHAMKECQVAKFHGQTSDAYAYVWMVQGSL
jgi:hypothetical protein